MLAEDYSKAIYESITEGIDIEIALTRLSVLLTKRGHTKLRPSILRNLVRMMEQRAHKDTAVVTVANESDITLLQDEIKKAEQVLSIAGNLEVSIQKNVIGGFNLSYQGKRIDKTYRTALFKLYKNITS